MALHSNAGLRVDCLGDGHRDRVAVPPNGLRRATSAPGTGTIKRVAAVATLGEQLLSVAEALDALDDQIVGHGRLLLNGCGGRVLVT